jgi:pentatricopeptide repeat protein
MTSSAQLFRGLLAACGMGGLAKEAAKLERHIRRKGFPATVEMYNGMIEAYSKAALYEEALSVLDGMTEAKIEPNEVRIRVLERERIRQN